MLFHLSPSDISIPSTDDRWQSHQPGDDHPWNGGKHSSPSGYGGSKAYKKPKTEPHDATGASPTGLNIPSTVDRTAGKGAGYAAAAAATSPTGVIKRYSCTSCPYTTDRRDLFTRHENIHKDEKPFQCYACLKPFNRADHVKKHFLRMHRELEYDIAKTRRHPPGGGSGGGKGGTYYAASSQTGGAATATSSSSSSSSSSSGGGGNATTAMTLAQMQLNIPSGSFSNAPSLVVPSHTLDSGSAHLNGSHQAQLLQLHSHHQQQQLQQQQQQQQQQHHHHHQQSHANLHPAQLAIKQEKGSSGSLNTSANSAGGSPDDKYAKKIKGEKKFACTYCPWAGADNWGLKRHLNTHTKPYVCLLCDYKAARSERLATHVLKVHNKKACSKCNFFAEDQAQLEAHLQEAHSHDPSKAGKAGSGSAGSGAGPTGGHCGTASSTSSTSAVHQPASGGGDTNGNVVLRNLGNAFTSNNLPTNIPTSGNGFGNAANLIETINQHVLASAAGQNGGGQQQQQQQQWIATRPHRKRGPDLLYSYLEADGSDSGDYARLLHMQAVGRNKASVTQDFRNAGGGDNNGGDAGDSSSSSSSSAGTSAAASPYALSMAAAAAIERQMKKKHHSADGKPSAASHDSVNLSLASLFGGDQLSFLQLLATAAVAHQQLQLHSSQQQQQQQQQQQPYLQPHHHHQQKKQQHQKPSKAVDHHHVGASNGGRYGSTMVSSPPATSTQQQQQHQQPPRATSTGTAPHSTNGNGATVPLIDPQYQQLQPLALDMGSMKKRRTASSASSAAAANSASSSDKENSIVHRNRINGGSAGTCGTAVPQQQQCNGTAAVVIVPNDRASAILNGGVTDKHNTPHKNGHHHHHHHHYNPHHHNNNNSSTSNKNINDIFDKVYKKPQNSLNASKQPQPAAHSLAATILRTAPPSAVEEDNRREADAARQDTAQAEQFSLTEFLKSHTEVSISTVGGKGAEDESPVTIIPLPLVADRHQTPEMKETEEQQKVLLEGERNPRKRYQPRRIGESDELPVPPPSDDPMAFVAVEMLDTSIETANKSPEPKEQAEEQQQQQQEGKAIDLKVQKQATHVERPQATVSRLADIRDKHMIKLITNRRCCRICRTSGLLDHLDNAHYHSRMSLFLHTLWRHRRSSAGMCECRKCGAQFARRYMLVLHQKLTKHTGMVVQAESGSKRTSKRATKRTAIKKSSSSSSSSKHVAGARKQRKRKPRSRCFTAKRKK
uniref:C2H2-type domain-containing protein n=1 Tax=Anopheles merus TaxID=30066 RepID=A0A182VBB2_ANOME